MMEFDEEVITELAQVHRQDLVGFFKVLQQYLNLQRSTGNIQPNQEGDFYYEVATILLQSYPLLALNCLILALRYFTKQNNRQKEESSCYEVMGVRNFSLCC